MNNNIKTNLNLKKSDIGKTLTFAGWANNVRKVSSKLSFIVLRNFHGSLQFVYKSDAIKDSKTRDKIDESIRLIKNETTLIITGKVVEKENRYEVLVDNIEIVSNVDRDLPLNVNEKEELINKDRQINEEIKNKYRYLDLRRKENADILKKRSLFNSLIRNFMLEKNFVEIETPTITKPTIGGAEEFLLKSVKNKGLNYSLVQSPQIYKQLLMYSGVDSYFQIARCYRDEGARVDRQIEFTQLDIEKSFVNEKEIKNLIEELLIFILKGLNLKDKTFSFSELTYDVAMKKYNSDKPKIGNRDFNFVWIVEPPLFEEDETSTLKSVHNPFSAIEVGRDNELKEYNHKTTKKSDVLGWKSRAYDITLNGVEIGGGAIRINCPTEQKNVFEILGTNEKEYLKNFGWFDEAQKYGVPRHGGIALGLDRLLSILLDKKSIREVIAFPKTSHGTDLLLENNTIKSSK